MISYHKQNMFFVKIASVIIFFIKIALALVYSNNVVFNKFSCNHQKYMCRGNPAHHFEKFSLNFYLSKFHWIMTRRHGLLH